MKKRVAAILMAMTMGITLLSGCGNSQGDSGEGNETGAVEQVVTHNIGANPQTLDPSHNAEAEGTQILRSISEGLTRTDEKEKAIPGVAESWEVSEDGLTYTFKLRDSLWTDGEPVVAGDFEYAWKRIVDPATASPNAYQLYYIKNAQQINSGDMAVDELAVKAIDDKTLEVVLESPTPYFAELIALTCYNPVRKDIIEADPEGWTINPETYISNGPFKMTKWAAGDVLTVEKNDQYYDADTVKLAKIDYVMLGETATSFAAFETGEIDYTEKIPSEQLALLQSEGNPDFKITPNIGTYFLVYNTEKEVFKDERVRKALSLAIDRQAIVDNVAKGGQVPAVNGFCPPGLALSTGKDFAETFGTTFYGAQADIEEAKKLLAEAGYPNGEGFPEIEYLHNTDDVHKAIAEAIQEMWKQNLGINVILRNEELGVFYTTRSAGDFEVARGGWTGDYADPMTFLDMWLTGTGLNSARWSNAEYDKLIETSRVSSGEDRDKILLDAHKILMDESPIMPVYYYTKPILMKSTIKGSYKSSLGPVVYRNAYVEAAEQ